MENRVGRALRRGVALGLALTAAWAVSLTADPGGVHRGLAALGEQPSLAVSLAAHQLGELPGTERGLTGWGRLLLRCSPLLAAGEGPVLALHSEKPSPDKAPDSSEGDDLEEPDLRPVPEGEDIVEMTGRGKEGSQYLRDGGVYVYNRTGRELDSSLLGEGTVDVSLGEGPQILIVHTHGSEAYSMTDGDVYEESDPYRTTDCAHNVVRVGEEMATVFRAYGFQVVHDTTLYDYPSYNDAYNRSVQGVAENLKKYPSIVLVLDVHRDALVANDGTIYKVVAGTVDDCAQVMMVLGSDASGQVHPNWKVNLALALSIQSALSDKWATLARPLVLRPTRFNQHLSTGTILVEVGTHGNTLQEAITAARLYTRTVVELMEQDKGSAG